MGSNNVFIIPIKDKECIGKKEDVVNYFQSIGLINELFEEEYSAYLGGNNNCFPEMYFEYIQIYDSNSAFFVPDAHTGRYGSKCPNCKAGLDDVLYENRESWPEIHQFQDMSEYKLKCPNCCKETLLSRITFEIETAMTHFFIMLGVVEEIDNDFITCVEKLLGCKVRLVLEHL